MTNFQALYDRADQAGRAAADACKPTPMVVGTPTTLLGNEIDRSKPTYYVADGVCGFAWVKWKGTSAWAKWAKKNGIGRGSHCLWVSAYNQSMQRKEAYAYAFARVLNEAGIKAYAESRMD